MGVSLNNPNPSGSQAAMPNPQQQDWDNEQNQVAMAQPSDQPMVKTTQYGYADDPNQDANSNVLKVGFKDNPLTPHAAALTDAEAQQLHAQPGDVLDVGGNKVYYADRAPESDPRVDLYQPQGFNKMIPDYQSVRDLGGGSSQLKGGDLSAAGEANVQKFTGGQASPEPQGVPTQQTSSTPIVLPAQNDSARASDNNQGIAFINLLKRLNYGKAT
jgi:hypothetical protein